MSTLIQVDDILNIRCELWLDKHKQLNSSKIRNERLKYIVLVKIKY